MNDDANVVVMNFDNVKEFVKTEMSKDNSGHGYQHALRVFANAKKILETEKKGDEKVVLTSALVHDVVDKKLFDSQIDRLEVVRSFLASQKYSADEIERILFIISNISWNGGNFAELGDNIDAQIVRDADRLDAVGAIGIIRTIEFGTSRNRSFYDDANLKFTKNGVEFGEYSCSTLSHFYEKMLKLKELMHTQTAKKIAEQRHEFMESFLKQFYIEIDETNEIDLPKD